MGWTYYIPANVPIDYSLELIVTWNSIIILKYTFLGRM